MSTHALVVGGTRGLGLEVARHFASLGQTVSVLGRRSIRPAPPLGAWACDLRDSAALARTLDDIVAARGPFHTAVFLQRFRGEGDTWQGECETSLTATRDAIEALVERFAPEGNRAIVLVGSIASRFVSDSQPVGYHVAKAGLVQLARYYAVRLGPRGIRVNCVSPSTVVKPENRDFYRDATALRSLFEQVIPLGRMGTAQDSANAIAFLCSEASSYITGQELTVDGGVSLLSQESVARKIAHL